ncbi:macrophage mannose receptor 1-like [Mizuhopecten yessoensis]|uniref:macrophage mannose receptor 1-like n=1 Tax=Mizuhopecten yessoensis TaxID=6573 RepID=UPI000B457B9F|nr:macrophage mannose receptor 1-like [Mizuhopecten yessoensis]
MRILLYLIAMYLLLFLGIFGVAIAQTSTDLTHCPGSVARNKYLKVYGGRCLQFVLHEKSWTRAKADCKSRGGNLVMIKTTGKQTFVYNTLKSLHWHYNGLWIGGSDSVREGKWVWVDGTPMSFGNWHRGQGPSAHHGFFFSSSSFEDCAQMRLDDSGRWHDYSCGRSYSYICEYGFTSTAVATAVPPHTTPRPVPKTTPRPRTTVRPKTTPSARTTLRPQTTVKPTTAQTSTDLTHCPGSVPRNNYLKVYGGKCLQFLLTERSWTQAGADCKSRGGSLVMIKNAGKQAFVYNTLKSLHWRYHGVWIGGSDRDKEGEWVWVDGSHIEYGNWHPGQGPTTHNGFFFSSSTFEDCAEMRLDDGGKWHDYPCGGLRYSYSYVCEYALASTVTLRPRTTVNPRTTIKPPVAQTSTDLTHCPGSVPRNNYLKVYGGKCLQFLLTERSWTKASADCKSRGGSLVMIKNAGKQAFVYNTLKSLHWRYHGVWIGGSDRDKEGEWVWVDGSHIEYGNWHPGQGPTTHNGFFFSSSTFEDCAEMRLDDGGKWHDYPCGGLRYSYSYVCEYALSSTAVSVVVPHHTTPRPVPKTTPRPRTTLRPIRPQTTSRPQTSRKPDVHSIVPKMSSTAKPGMLQSTKPNRYVASNGANRNHFSASQQRNPKPKSTNETGVIVGVVVGGLVFVALLAAVVVVQLRRKRTVALSPMSIDNKLYGISPSQRSEGEVY